LIEYRPLFSPLLSPRIARSNSANKDALILQCITSSMREIRDKRGRPARFGGSHTCATPAAGLCLDTCSNLPKYEPPPFPNVPSARCAFQACFCLQCSGLGSEKDVYGSCDRPIELDRNALHFPQHSREGEVRTPPLFRYL
jgi:hypothetical protein